MEDERDLALDCFDQGFNCAQSVLSTFSVRYGLDVDQALRVAGGFGGGMARLGETCGAVTGGMMVIGLLYGKTRQEDDAAKEKTYRMVRQFVDQFTARNGSILCRELVGCDLSTLGGFQKARDAHLFKTLCPLFVRFSAEILQNLIREEQS